MQMKILVINTGSSSIKYQLFEMEDHTVLAGGMVERIGEASSKITYKVYGENPQKTESNEVITDHKTGLLRVVSLLVDEKLGVIKDKSEVGAIGHRVVHGGEEFVKPAVIDDTVIKAIERNIPLAPLHNPSNIVGITVSREIFPNAKQVAVFDTAFHHTMPEKAYRYALPSDLYERYKIRRYGFHGTSHQFVSEAAASLLNRKLKDLNLITIHLGNGGSITAVKSGASIDTSMGMTPLEGLVMGTRSGDIDPAIPAFLTRNSEATIEDVDRMLNTRSGLKGICGKNDMREILAAADRGDKTSKLAVEMFCYRVKKYIGAYMAVLGRVDSLVFTAGIGEHSAEIRERICEDLEQIGIILDIDKNREKIQGNRELHSARSQVKILLIPTNEELKIALETHLLVSNDNI